MRFLNQICAPPARALDPDFVGAIVSAPDDDLYDRLQAEPELVRPRGPHLAASRSDVWRVIDGLYCMGGEL